MENNQGKDENGQLENKNTDDSDLYANPFSSVNESNSNNNINNDNKNQNNNTQNEIKENGINKTNNDTKENQKILNEDKNIEEKKENKGKIIENDKNIKKDNVDEKNIKEPKIENNQKKEEKINTQEKKPKYFVIKETGDKIYIENIKKMVKMSIEKSLNKLYVVKDINEMLNLNIIKSYYYDAVLGIIDINGNNKYILVVSSSKLVANIIGADIYNILDVDLIKITLFNESDNERSRILGVKKLFQSKNFYYSNKIDLCQNLFIKNRKNIINDFCINSSLLKLFFDNNISSEFYTKVIYGYVGFKKNTEIKNDKIMIMVDNIIIERVNKHLKFNSDITNQMKEIEFINIYKANNINSNNKNKYNIKIFSFNFYVSNEIANSNVPFNPWNNFITNLLILGIIL